MSTNINYFHLRTKGRSCRKEIRIDNSISSASVTAISASAKSSRTDDAIKEKGVEDEQHVVPGLVYHEVIDR